MAMCVCVSLSLSFSFVFTSFLCIRYVENSILSGVRSNNEALIGWRFIHGHILDLYIRTVTYMYYPWI